LPVKRRRHGFLHAFYMGIRVHKVGEKAAI
jgi:hypothetical protein